MNKEPPTTDRIRHEIDSGRTGEKVDFPDPAAAPLGSDAEAGGAPPSSAARAMDARAQSWFLDERKFPGLVLYAVFAGTAMILILASATVAA
jgi:hypothetical protein